MRSREMGMVYFVLAFVGLVLPYAQVLPWLGQHGLAPGSFVTELFSTRIGGFFGLDVIVSALVLFVFIGRDGRGVPMRWLPVAATLLVGVSCGLPLFLGLREWRAR